MKHIFIVLTLLSFIIGHSQKTNFGFGHEIKGEIKEYTETWYKAEKKNDQYIKLDKLHYDSYRKNENNVFVKLSTFEPEKHEISQTTFNEEKQKIEEINYYESGEIMNKTKYFYKNGKLIHTYFYYHTDTIITKTYYYYDKDLKVKDIEIKYNYAFGNSIDTIKTTYPV